MRELTITIAGEPGSGKTTLSRELAVALKKYGIEVELDDSVTVDGDFLRPRVAHNAAMHLLAMDKVKVILKNVQTNRMPERSIPPLARYVKRGA